MRASGWLLGVAVVCATVGMVGAGCGGSSQESPSDAGSADATRDQGAPETGMPEAAMDAMDAAAMDSGMACAVDADLTTAMVPDASIGDSGATTETCYACIESNCGSQLADCNADCTCKTNILGFVQCVGSGGSLTACGSGLALSGDPATTALGRCVAGPLLGGSGPGCLQPCGVTLPDGGSGDGGQMGDAASDAATTDAAGD
jgi:hypothetical protein